MFRKIFDNRALRLATVLVLVAVLVVQSTFWGEAQPAQADALSDYQKQQAAIQSEINTLRQSLNALKGELNEQQTALANADMKVKQSEDTLAALTNQLKAANKELEYANIEFSAAQTKLAQQLNGFKTRLRENYMNGDVSLLDVLFDATSMEDFITRSYYMERILLYDSNMIETINGTIDEIKEKRAIQEQKISNLTTLKAEQEKIQAELESARAEQKKLTDEAQDDVDEVTKEIKQRQKESNEIAAIIQSMQDPGTGSGSGTYSWPLKGYSTISSGYGWRTLRGKRNLHTGIDIPAPKGTAIYAIDSGKVILSRNYGSYGECVIIDHGNGISSLYAHQSKRVVSVGDTIAKGQKIGEVGSTGNSTGNHLHLEIRKNGSHVSPWNYVSKP